MVETLHASITKRRPGADALQHRRAGESRSARSPASRRRPAQGAQIVCLQELFRSQYFCQSRGHRHLRSGRADSRAEHRGARRASRRRAAWSVVGSLFEKRAEGVFHNTAVLIDADGALAGLYRKMHIPDDPLYYEKYYFTPGDLGFRSFDTRAAAGSARWSAGTSGFPRRRA